MNISLGNRMKEYENVSRNYFVLVKDVIDMSVKKAKEVCSKW